MKDTFTTLLLLMFVYLPIEVFANDTNSTLTTDTKPEINSIFDVNNIKTGGFWGAFDIDLFTMNGTNNVSSFMGGRFGILFNNSISIGGAMYGLLPTNQLDEPLLETDKPLVNMIYGGLYLEYILFPKNTFHLNFNLLLGGGTIGYSYDNHYYYDTNSDGEWQKHDYYVFQDAFGMIEPGVALEINIASFMRIDFGASYKLYTNFISHDIDLRDEDFENLNWNISFIFGIF